jgi:AcrR family transcriptional regulator
MGINERKERQREMMRRRILDAAMDIALQHGIEAVSLRAIARQIEYSAATIYLHFKNKKALLHSLVEESLQRIKAGLEDRPGENDPGEELRSVMHFYLSHALDHPQDLRLILQMNPPEAPAVPPYRLPGHHRVYEGLVGDFKTRHLDKSLVFTDQRAAIVTVLGFLHGILSLSAMNRLPIIEDIAVPGELHRALDAYIDAAGAPRNLIL